MKNLDVVDILRLGAIGLGFLLALMSYRLLAKEQTNKEARPAILGAIKTYMGFALILVLLATVSEIVKLAYPGQAAQTGHVTQAAPAAPVSPDKGVEPTSQKRDVGQPHPGKPAFDFADYLAQMRIQYEHAATPDHFQRGDLAELGVGKLTLDMKAGACERVLAVVAPANEAELDWSANGAGARSVQFSPSGTSNLKVGRLCTGDDPAQAAQVLLMLKMTRGSGPFAIETYFESQRIYPANH